MMQWGRLAAVALSMLLISGSVVAAEKSSDAKAEVQKASEAWLALVDAGKYAESWEEAAALFRGAVTKNGWVSAVQGARGPLGKLKSRKLKSAEYKTSLPGAPDGQYVVTQYDAVFENKASAVETITPTLEKDGNWRVAGYFIR